MKSINYGECFFSSINVNIVLKPYNEDYESLQIDEELDRVKFSLSDQYQHEHNSFDNI